MDYFNLNTDNNIHVFCKTTEHLGVLSNMAKNMELVAGDTLFSSSEALYQAMRFPDYPELQLEISKLAAYNSKQLAYKHLEKTRADWNDVRIDVMRYCLELKLLNNYKKFSSNLAQTQLGIIVEKSRKDDFWGAKPLYREQSTLRGRNHLGYLLMELRNKYVYEGLSLMNVKCDVPNFKLLGEFI